MSELKTLSIDRMKMETGGEILTLTSVMAVLAIALVAVICYRIFTSSKGSTTLPGGFKFDWGK